jgi:transposase
MKTSKKAKYPTIQIVEGFREGKKVKQRTVAHLGVVKSKKDLVRLKDLADKLIQRLEKEGLEIDPRVEVKKLRHKRTIYNGFNLVVEKLMSITGLDKIVELAQGKQRFNLLETTKLILARRFDCPCSKLRTYERQEDLGFSGIDLQHLYRSMDVIESVKEKIQQQAFEVAYQASEGRVECLFFDVTTLYFESTVQDDLRNFGFSKDQKQHLVQVVLALVINAQGLPIAYEVFRGNLAETKTLLPILKNLRNRFAIDDVTVVCDRGLASQQNVEALQQERFHFIIAAKLKALCKKLEINNLSNYQFLPGQETLPEEERIRFCIMDHPQYTDAKLIVTYSPSRAKKDQQDRKRLLEKLKSKLSDSLTELPVKKLISNSGYRKYTRAGKEAKLILDEKAIEEDEKWDGFHGLSVSKGTSLSIREALSRYHDLWHIEEAFRIAKCTLRTRPVFHWVSRRIKSHVLLCFINLFLERFLEYLLRKNAVELTPDRIRYALSQVHATIFEDESRKLEGKMESMLSQDAEKIFATLGISTERGTTLGTTCCA